MMYVIQSLAINLCQNPTTVSECTQPLCNLRTYPLMNSLCNSHFFFVEKFYLDIWIFPTAPTQNYGSINVMPICRCPSGGQRTGSVNLATQLLHSSLTDRWPQTLVKMAPTKVIILVSPQDEHKEKWPSQWVGVYCRL